MYKTQKGITLVSLVITIIILTILAGLTINLSFGEYGIFTRAKQAKENMEISVNEEEEKIKNLLLKMNNAGEEDTEEVLESGIWRAKKSRETNSSVVKIYVYSIYNNQTIPNTLNEYKEQYIVKTFNEMAQQSGSDMKVNNLDELVLNAAIYMENDGKYTLIDDYLSGNSKVGETREEFIVEQLNLKCETSEYANAMLEQMGYTSENILEIETKYEEAKNNQNIDEIPDEIKTATYVVTYPDGTTQEVLGSNLNSFKGSYNVQENGNNIIKITNLDEETKLKVSVSNLRKKYTDEWYLYTYDTYTNGYTVRVKDTTLTTYGEIKNDVYGIPITKLQETYAGCQNLTNLSFKKFNASNVKSMVDMFYACSLLESLDLSNFYTSNVTNMEGMFWNCSALTSLDVSKFDTSNVTNMEGMFSGCSLLTSLDVSKFDTSNVTNMGYMFSGCSKLKSLDLSKFDTRKVTDMSGMFKDCKALTSLDVSKFDTSNVTNMANMFYYCESLTKLDVSNFNTSNVTDMRRMFSRCELLTSLDVTNFDTSKVTDMGWMFFCCSGLTSLDLSNFNTSNVTDMSNMFYSCSGLTSLDLSSFNTVKVTNMNKMFYNCNLLTTIYIGENWTNANATTTDMFTGCGTSEVTNKS